MEAVKHEWPLGGKGGKALLSRSHISAILNQASQEQGHSRLKGLTSINGVQSVTCGPHAAQDGYEFGPTQNHKFT